MHLKPPQLNKATTKSRKKGIFRKTFTTSAVKLEHRDAEQVEQPAPASPTTLVCLFCKDEHVIETCNNWNSREVRDFVSAVSSMVT